MPQQHPARPKRERRAAQPLTYPADQTNSSRTEMAREKKNVEQYFARMQRKLAAEEDGPAPLEVEPTPAEEPKAKKQARPSKRTEVEPMPAEEPKTKKQARPSKRTEVEPTPAEELKAKKQARPSKRTSEVQKIAEAPAEPPEPVLFAEVVCSEVMTMAQMV